MKTTINFNGESKQVNFTKPQSEIIERVQKGGKMQYFGNALLWVGTYEYVGVRALQGAMYAIEKAFGVSTSRAFFGI